MPAGASSTTNGRLLNADEAIGEIVNSTRGTFEGYWNNPEANAERMRDGAYWTGDLGYRDDDGYFYFAGRSADWIRVDGENFAGAPVERILSRFAGVVLAAVYAVPDPVVGDQVMAALAARRRRRVRPRRRSPRSSPRSPTSARSGRRRTCASCRRSR